MWSLLNFFDNGQGKPTTTQLNNRERLKDGSTLVARLIYKEMVSARSLLGRADLRGDALHRYREPHVGKAADVGIGSLNRIFSRE